ncbi:hypothetical protein EST38_g10741 [Candolleomyces aberdarensis]|uniref:NACHT domain-containing protein n=1 Tax=Candolleomyces aberdarensis TaxID=2316362 RepID=A0A4V1Q2H5_9AGAR|nr:hypothetical protein EST38_g10741 [Candolleomyces aberdarensis]
MALLRFAPSPTGPSHLGGLRMALYTHLYGKETWILRIEDTDAVGAYIWQALDWAGLEYDFGPGKKGPHSPFFQPERLDLYEHYAKKLFEGTQLPTRPGGVDLIFGQLKDTYASLATDLILLKSDLFPTYHLASVVDDHEMGITHVLRGEGWLPSLLLHPDLYASLNLQPPQFAHLPILLNVDGSKMSKRNGDVHVDDYIKRGWKPISVINWLALAGWGTRHDPFTEPAEPKPNSSSPSSTHSHQSGTDAPDSTGVYTLPQLISEFDLTSVTHRNSTLDPMKLEYLNKQHLLQQRSTPDGLTAMAERVHDSVKDAFSEMYVCCLLGGRTTCNAIQYTINRTPLFSFMDGFSNKANMPGNVTTRNSVGAAFAGASNFGIENISIRTAGNVYKNYNISVNAGAIGTEDNDVGLLRKISEWLTTSSFRNIHSEALAKRTPGTGLWFTRTNEYRLWTQSNLKVLWGTGKPGAGKTILSAIIVDHLQKEFSSQKRVPVIFAYCRYTEKYPTSQFLAAWIRQLLEHDPTTLRYISEMFAIHQRQDTRPSEAELHELLSAICTGFEKVYIILDGLDEAREAVKIQLLEEINTLPSNTRTLITSRPLKSFEYLVPDAAHIDIEARNEDIELFVEKKIAQMPRLHTMLAGKDGEKHRICKAIKEKSGGM